MAKANLVLVDGTKVAIEGTAEEVALLLHKFSSPGTAASPEGEQEPRKVRTAGPKKTAERTLRKGPQKLMADLIEDGWFKSKRTIGEVQKKLEEKGHIYAMESLSTPLLRLTRLRTLRRIKDKGGWVYVS